MYSTYEVYHGKVLEMWGSTAKGKAKGNQQGNTFNTTNLISINSDSFVTSGDKKDVLNDIRKFANIMNIPMEEDGSGYISKPQIIKDITDEVILGEDD